MGMPARATILAAGVIAIVCVTGTVVSLVMHAPPGTIRALLVAVTVVAVLMAVGAGYVASVAARRAAGRAHDARALAQLGQADMQQMVNHLLRGERPPPPALPLARTPGSDQFEMLLADLEQFRYAAGQALLRIAAKVFGRSDQQARIFVNLAWRMQSLVHRAVVMLDGLLEDRRVTATEAESLRDLAVSLGVGADAVIAAHQMYLRALASIAWADGVITDAEYADLGEVAHLLGFPAHAVDIELTAARGMTTQTTVPLNGRTLHAGDAVCITGNTVTPREELEARAADVGLRVTSAVSRKTRLVVAADPDSESAKARRARELGVALIAEAVFLAMLDRGISHHPAEPATGSL
jgi:NAD-dependent DNA ligase